MERNCNLNADVYQVFSFFVHSQGQEKGNQVLCRKGAGSPIDNGTPWLAKNGHFEKNDEW